jgi:fluoride ion exporter CrcB/FEX
MVNNYGEGSATRVTTARFIHADYSTQLPHATTTRALIAYFLPGFFVKKLSDSLMSSKTSLNSPAIATPSL